MFGVLTSLLCGLTRTALPSAPQHLTANDTGATYAVLTWLPPEDTDLVEISPTRCPTKASTEDNLI